jgi:hypothetical protein
MKRSFALIVFILAGAISSPVTAQISVRSQLSHDKSVVPGEQYSGAILVRNDSDQPQQAKVYQTDYLFQADGSNYFGDPGKLDRSNADWIDVAASQVVVPPRSAIEITYRVNVPNDINGTAPNGSYWSIIMVEGIPETSPENLENELPDNSYGVMQVTRYGVQVASHLEDTNGAALTITESQLTRSDEAEATLNLAVRNDGHMLVRPDMWVELYAADGTAVGRMDGQKSRLYPGTSITQRIKLGKLDPGAYRALVIMDAGEEDVFGAEFTLNID